MKFISLKISLSYSVFVLFGSFYHLYIKFPGQDSNFLSFLPFSSFYSFSLVSGKFSQIHKFIFKTLILLFLLLYFEFPKQVFFLVLRVFLLCSSFFLFHGCSTFFLSSIVCFLKVTFPPCSIVSLYSSSRIL